MMDQYLRKDGSIGTAVVLWIVDQVNDEHEKQRSTSRYQRRFPFGIITYFEVSYYGFTPHEYDKYNIN